MIRRRFRWTKTRRDVTRPGRSSTPQPQLCPVNRRKGGAPLVALREQALDVWVHHADERAVRRDARHDRVEGFAGATAHGDRREAFRHVTFNLPSGVGFGRAVGRDRLQLVVGVGRRVIREHRLDEA